MGQLELHSMLYSLVGGCEKKFHSWNLRSTAHFRSFPYSLVDYIFRP